MTKVRLALTLAIFLAMFSRPAHAQEVVTIVLYRDEDAITLYITNDGLVSLQGLTLEATTATGEVLSRALERFPSFIGLQFDRLVGPLCFQMENRARPATLPLECRQIPPERLFIERLTPADLLWYDSVAREARLLVIRRGDEVFGRCPAEIAECEVPYIPAQGDQSATLAPLPTAAPAVIPVIGTATVSRATQFRKGPGPQYDILATVSAGTYDVIGRNAAGSYYLLNYNGQDAWVSAFATSVQFRVAQATPTPDLSVTPLDAALAYGQEVAGMLDRNQKTAYTFVGRAGEVFSVVVAAKFDGYLEVYDAQNFLLTEDDNGGGDNNPQINGFILPKNGTYKVVLRGYTARDSGSFRLKLLKGRVPLKTSGANTLAYGQKFTDALTPNGQVILVFDGVAGDIISIMVSADFDSYIQLQNADGKVLVSDDDSGGNKNPLLELFKLPATGTYRLLLRGNSAKESGTYTIQLLQSASSANQAALKSGVPVSGTLKAGERNVFVIDSAATQTLSLSITAQFEAVLMLRDARGSLLAQKDIPANKQTVALFNFKLPVKGSYFLVIAGATEIDAGTFALDLTLR